MSFLYDQIYEDVKNLIKKYDSRNPREILIQRGVNICLLYTSDAADE